MALRAAGTRFLARTVRAPMLALPVRDGGGGPVALGKPVSQPLPEEDELLWDDGSAQPEFCLDQFDGVSKYEALAWNTGGLLFFAGLVTAAVYNDKKSKAPFVPKELPFDNLKEELGRD